MNTVIENKSLEVFGTIEVAVKEFMGSTDKSLVLLSDYQLAKKNLKELKLKHESRVLELVSIDKLSPTEFKELNDIRAKLREPRYLLQNIEKNNVSVFEAYKKTDKEGRKELIDINHSLEETASDKLKLEEGRKKLEKEAEAKAEEIRVERIKKQIDDVETYCYQIIQKMTFDNMKPSCESIDQSLNADYDFEEYELLFDQVKDRVAKLLLDKTNDITSRENQRLENESMKQEIFQVRVNRFKELGFELNDSGFFRSIESSMTYSSDELLNIDSASFEREIANIKQEKEKQEQAILDAQLSQQRNEHFEVRKNRIFELGFGMTDNLHFMFCKEFSNISIPTEKIYQADVFEFEEMISKAKLDVIDAENKQEQDELDRLEAKKKEAIAKKKADAENKARVKRLAQDKEWLLQNIQLSVVPIEDVSITNEESLHFVVFANLQIEQLKSDLLKQLKDL